MHTACKSVIGRYCNGNLVFEKGFKKRVGFCHARRTHAKIGVTLRDGFCNLICGMIQNSNTWIEAFCLNQPQCRKKKGNNQCRDHCQRYHSISLMRESDTLIPHCTCCFLGTIQYRFGAWKKAFGRESRFHKPRGSLEQGGAENLFQLLNATGDR